MKRLPILRRSLAAIAAIGPLLALVPSVRAQTIAPGQGAADRAPASDSIIGPGGREIIAQGDRADNGNGATPGLRFRRVAGSDTKGTVLGANRLFDTDRLPATFGATLASGETCTATLIGPQVLLTAAHCVDRKQRGSHGKWLTYGGRLENPDGQLLAQIRGCDMAPAYVAAAPTPGRPRNEQDFALCETWTPVNALAEAISRDAAAVAPDSALLIVGYGCTEGDLVDGQITAGAHGSGHLNVGINTVRQGGPAGWLAFYGRVGSSQAILCPGDSGGGAFAHASIEPGAGNDSGWRVVAVNSAVGHDKTGTPKDYISYLASLADPDFATFLDTWMKRRPLNRGICGVDLSSPGSRCRP